MPARGDGISTVVLSVCDLDERLILVDVVAFGDEPAGDLASVRPSPRSGSLNSYATAAERRQKASARRTASTTRSTEGMYQSSSCQYGYGTS